MQNMFEIWNLLPVKIAETRSKFNWISIWTKIICRAVGKMQANGTDYSTLASMDSVGQMAFSMPKTILWLFRSTYCVNQYFKWGPSGSDDQNIADGINIPVGGIVNFADGQRKLQRSWIRKTLLSKDIKQSTIALLPLGIHKGIWLKQDEPC